MDISILVGQTLEAVTKSKDGDEILFKTATGKTYRMFHYPDCCESVTIDDINGDLQDLVGSPIIQAEESSNKDEDPEEAKGSEVLNTTRDSYTWTFYRIATTKGLVVIRWYGESNGYYSESVDLEEVKT